MNNDSQDRILRIQKRDHSYVVIDKNLLADPNISFRSKGILCYLLSKPDDWTVRVKDLVKHSPKEGEDAIQACLQELRKFGYAKLARGGESGGSYWLISETPTLMEDDKKRQAENRVVGGGRQAGLPTVGLTDSRQNGSLLSTDTGTETGKGTEEEHEPSSPVSKNSSELVGKNGNLLGRWLDRYLAVKGYEFVTPSKSRDGKFLKVLAEQVPPDEIFAVAERAWSSDIFESKYADRVPSFCDHFVNLRKKLLGEQPTMSPGLFAAMNAR